MVFRVLAHHEVLWHVVVLIAIHMVDVGTSGQRMPEGSLRHKHMYPFR